MSARNPDHDGEAADPTAAAESLGEGSRLGPYRVVAPIGAGGMAHVFRARDERLGREVAIKVLSPSLRSDSTLTRRFEQEARAIAALSHPNVLAVYDFDARGETPYLVTELLEGCDLRQVIGEKRPWQKTVGWAIQIASGLAAAHARGIVHRDVKPANLFLTRDGRVKILDFGVAKPTGEPPRRDAVTVEDRGPVREAEPEPSPDLTAPGALVGTVGYMAPEQLRRQPFDHRADVFAFGAVLYELLTGRTCFDGNTPIERAASVLKGEPPPPPPDLEVPPALWRITQRCLRKAPADRFQSTQDLVLDLEALLDGAEGREGRTAEEVARPALAPSPTRGGPALTTAVAVALAAALSSLLTAAWLARPAPDPGPPRYQRITFRRGSVSAARLLPVPPAGVAGADAGRAAQIVYAAGVEGEPQRVFVTTPDNPEGRALTPAGTGLFALSSRGEMALRLRDRVEPTGRGGTLARAPLDGGEPREVIDGVTFADWSPDGTQLAVVRAAGVRDRLEYPVGHVLFETEGRIGHPRVSPRGDAVAFVHWPVVADDRGTVDLVTLDGKHRALSSRWLSVRGLAFAPGGGEVWFAAGGGGEVRGVHGVTLDGRERLVAEGAGSVVLEDVAADGRMLVVRDLRQRSIHTRHTRAARSVGGAPGDASADVDRDLSWFDSSYVVGISRDARRLLFIEGAEGARQEIVTWWRALDGSPAVRLGDGIAWDISADGEHALMSFGAPYRQVSVVPLGPGDPRALPGGEIGAVQGGGFLPDGQRVVIGGLDQQGRARVWVQDVAGGEPRRVAEGFQLGSPPPAAPDGSAVLATDETGRTVRLPLDGGAPTPIRWLREDEQPQQWLADGRVLVLASGHRTAHAALVDPVTGARSPLVDLSPPDARGDAYVPRVLVSDDGATLVYQLKQNFGELYLVRGAR